MIYPTIDEPYGRVPFEAIGALTYPVIPDKSGSAEYIRPLHPGCIYKHQNKDSLSQILLALEKKDRVADAPALKAAQDWLAREINWDRVTGKVLALYQELCRENISKIKSIKSDHFPHPRQSERPSF